MLIKIPPTREQIKARQEFESSLKTVLLADVYCPHGFKLEHDEFKLENRKYCLCCGHQVQIELETYLKFCSRCLSFEVKKENL